jgi:hypothetical protein
MPKPGTVLKPKTLPVAIKGVGHIIESIRDAEMNLAVRDALP